MNRVKISILLKCFLYIFSIIIIATIISFTIYIIFEKQIDIEHLFIFNRVIVLLSSGGSLIIGILVISKIEKIKYSISKKSLSWKSFLLIVILITIFALIFIDGFIIHIKEWWQAFTNHRTFSLDGNNNNLSNLNGLEKFIIVLKSIIIIPILEEIFFRGAILKMLLRPFSPLVAILINALLFSLYHGIFIPHILLSFLLSGLLLAFLYWRFRSLLLIIVLHTLFNIIVFLETYWLIWFENLYAWQFLILLCVVIVMVIFIYLKFLDNKLTFKKLIEMDEKYKVPDK